MGPTAGPDILRREKPISLAMIRTPDHPTFSLGTIATTLHRLHNFTLALQRILDKSSYLFTNSFFQFVAVFIISNLISDKVFTFSFSINFNSMSTDFWWYIGLIGTRKISL